MTEEPLADSAPGDAYRKLLDRLSMGLDPTTRNVLNLAAVLGPRMNDLDMYALMDMSLGQTMGAMSQLTELRILRDGTYGLEFVNELIRAQTYLEVPSPLRRTLHGRIADSLLELGEQATQAAGLEIAWHCVRAGRADEATPYLLQGARAAMRRGAPYEAERALASAVGHLQEPERSEAVILLARALNEQGRLKESLTLLERFRPLASKDQEDIARILTIYHKLRILARSEVDEAADRSALIAIARSSQADRTRAFGITVACRVLPENETPSLDRELLDIMSKILEEGLDLETRGALALARGRVLYRQKDLGAARREVEDAVELLSGRESESSTVASLRVASAILSTAGGEYESALAHLNTAWRISTRLGNDFLCSSVAGNLAICHSRLGDFSEQIEWGNRAVEYAATTRIPHHIMLYTSVIALGYSLTGQTSRAITTLEKGDSLPALSEDRFVHQSWCLHCADSLLLLGQHKRALEKAREAGVGSRADFSVATIVGKYARWTAIQGHLVNRQPAGRILDQLMSQRASYDRLDQVEILNAKVWFDFKSGCGSSDDREWLERELDSMPLGVRVLLERLRMLDFRAGREEKQRLWSPRKETLPPR
jgi:tetratricopeptide (TPR) repeat protein